MCPAGRERFPSGLFTGFASWSHGGTSEKNIAEGRQQAQGKEIQALTEDNKTEIKANKTKIRGDRTTE